jgi:DNA-binding IclR family transcriptional regulator
MKKSEKSQAAGVQAVVKALRILDAFGQQKPKLSLGELSRETGFYKSTILRQADTLVEKGYLVRDPETGKFQLGAKLYILGQIYGRSSSLLEVVPPILTDLALKSGETTAIFVVEGLQRLCLTMVQSSQFIRAAVDLGDRLPLYAGASGKTLLAYSDNSLVEKVIAATGLKPFTENTITDPETLRSGLASIRRKGYAVSFGESAPSAVACTVPVFGAQDELVCSLSISGPAERFGKEKLTSFITMLREAGEKISARLGYQGDFWRARSSDQARSNDIRSRDQE